MKKLIIGSIFTVAIAVTVALNVNLTSSQSVLSDVALSNVEALAKGEGDIYACCPPFHFVCSTEDGYYMKGVIKIGGC